MQQIYCENLLLAFIVKYGVLSKHLFQTRFKLCTVVKSNVFHISHGIKNIHRSKLYQ